LFKLCLVSEFLGLLCVGHLFWRCWCCF